MDLDKLFNNDTSKIRLAAGIQLALIVLYILIWIRKTIKAIPIGIITKTKHKK